MTPPEPARPRLRRRRCGCLMGWAPKVYMWVVVTPCETHEGKR